MKENKYLAMSNEELYSELTSKIRKDPERGTALLNACKEEEAYHEDHCFRLTIDAANSTRMNLMGEFDEALPLCEDLIERATSYKMWRELTIAYISMGNAFTGLGIFERAIEFYLRSIETGKKYGYYDLISVSFANIGLNYAKVDHKEKSIEYLRLALSTLESGGQTQPRYEDKKVHFLSALALELCGNQQMDEAKSVLDEIDSLMSRMEEPLSLYEYELAKLNHYFHMGEIEKGREHYLKAIDFIKRYGIASLTLMVAYYVRLCESYKIDYAYYIEDLLEAEKNEKLSDEMHSYVIYNTLRQYYQSIGNRKEYERLSEVLIEVLMRNSDTVQDYHYNAISLVERLVKKTLADEKLSVMNVELNRIVQEAIKNKHALQEAYGRIEVINELGRRLTSSLDIDEVVQLIYRTVKDNMDMDVFMIMVPNHEEQILRTISNYENDEKVPEIIVPLSREDSIFVRCYQDSCAILSWDAVYESYFKKQHEEEERPSAIFLPLIVGNKTIGVWSVQYIGANAYVEEHVDFLKEITPFLSIAINNALRSWELEAEILSRKKAEEKLKKLNSKLERMSFIDGLTEINNRRVFETKFLELLSDAKAKKTSIFVLMIDIDNFKLYNDNYGHLEGDVVLKEVAQIFRDNMDTCSGLSARFGGEEFIGAVVGLSKEEGLRLAEKIRQDIQDQGIIHEYSVYKVLTVSIGICMTRNAEPGMKSELMRIADESLYMAKNGGRNKVVLTEI